MTPRLRGQLVPEGLWTSPYEVLDYASTLTLHDPRGARATFAREQSVRFLQAGVGAILDHAWGDGVLLTDYKHTAGPLWDSFRDGERRQLVVALPRPMGRGEELRFAIRRRAMAAFTAEAEWLETVIDHPVRRLRCTVVFPPTRPCRLALLVSGARQLPLAVRVRADRRTEVGINVRRPVAHRANLFFQLISHLYTRTAVIVTTNVTFEGWGQVFGGDAMLAAAILDRLLHYSHVFLIAGPSHRMKDKRWPGLDPPTPPVDDAQ